MKHRITEGLVELPEKLAAGERVDFYFAPTVEPYASEQGRRGRHAFGLLVVLRRGQWVEPIIQLGDSWLSHNQRGAVGATITALEWLDLNASPGAPPDAVVHCSEEMISKHLNIDSIDGWIDRSEDKREEKLLGRLKERLAPWPGVIFRHVPPASRAGRGKRGLAVKRNWRPEDDVRKIYRELAYRGAQEALDQWMRKGWPRRPGDVVEEDDFWPGGEGEWQFEVSNRLRETMAREGL